MQATIRSRGYWIRHSQWCRTGLRLASYNPSITVIRQLILRPFEDVLPQARPSIGPTSRCYGMCLLQRLNLSPSLLRESLQTMFLSLLHAPKHAAGVTQNPVFVVATYPKPGVGVYTGQRRTQSAELLVLWLYIKYLSLEIKKCSGRSIQSSKTSRFNTFRHFF